MVMQFALLCCYASKETPMKRISLLLGLTLILGNILNALISFFLIYFQLDFSKIAFVSIYLILNFLLFLTFRNWLNDKIFAQIIEKRKLISDKQNLKYQIILLLIVFMSLLSILLGVILGFEFR